MFDKEYVFKGKHAQMVDRLKGVLSTDINKGIFRTNYQIYQIAPIIGYLFKRKAPVDKSDYTSKIFKGEIMDHAEEFKYNYRLLMLLLYKDEKDTEELKNIVFRLDNKDEERIQYDLLYDDYVRGGIEVLYEHIFEDANEPDEYIINLYNFITDFNSRYYAEVPDTI